jgi:hypothetical protein
VTITLEDLIAEEARGALWREQRQRRAAYQQALWTSLAAPSGPRDQQYANWDAYLRWRAEAEEPPIDPIDDPDVDPLGISDTVNVGR